MRRGVRATTILAAALTLPACRGETAAPATAAGLQQSAEFRDYWYAGKAELSRYRLRQSRYGSTYDGDAVLIFVTEDFLRDAQVKYEGRGSAAGAVSVLKLNFTRKFLTGIYPYSMMTSVFAPVDGSAALKVSTSVQEWCGHTYSQLNRRGGGYRGQLHSYFQQEADRDFSLGDVVLEDGIWTRIRLAPETLPVGELRVVPGLQYARLRHRPSAAERAVASWATDGDGQPRLRTYRIDYPELPRTLEITFEAGFPHGIVAWEEREEAAGQVTRAERTHTALLAYWTLHDPGDEAHRKQLGLD